jgi:hypothetical protein
MTIGGKEDRRPSISTTSWFSNASRNVTRIHCPRGLMDKASDSGSEDCQFDSDRGELLFFLSPPLFSLSSPPPSPFSSFLLLLSSSSSPPLPLLPRFSCPSFLLTLFCSLRTYIQFSAAPPSRGLLFPPPAWLLSLPLLSTASSPPAVLLLYSC